MRLNFFTLVTIFLLLIGYINSTCDISVKLGSSKESEVKLLYKYGSHLKERRKQKNKYDAWANFTSVDLLSGSNTYTVYYKRKYYSKYRANVACTNGVETVVDDILTTLQIHVAKASDLDIKVKWAKTKWKSKETIFELEDVDTSSGIVEISCPRDEVEIELKQRGKKKGFDVDCTNSDPCVLQTTPAAPTVTNITIDVDGIEGCEFQIQQAPVVSENDDGAIYSLGDRKSKWKESDSKYSKYSKLGKYWRKGKDDDDDDDDDEDDDKYSKYRHRSSKLNRFKSSRTWLYRKKYDRYKKSKKQTCGVIPGKYQLVLKQGSKTVYSDFDCTSDTKTLTGFSSQLNVSFDSMENVSVVVYPDDSTDLPVITKFNQTSYCKLKLLKGKYKVAVKNHGITKYFKDVDCSGEECEVNRLVCRVKVKFHGMKNMQVKFFSSNRRIRKPIHTACNIDDEYSYSLFSGQRYRVHIKDRYQTVKQVIRCDGSGSYSSSRVTVVSAANTTGAGGSGDGDSLEDGIEREITVDNITTPLVVDVPNLSNCSVNVFSGDGNTLLYSATQNVTNSFTQVVLAGTYQVKVTQEAKTVVRVVDCGFPGTDNTDLDNDDAQDAVIAQQELTATQAGTTVGTVTNLVRTISVDFDGKTLSSTSIVVSSSMTTSGSTTTSSSSSSSSTGGTSVAIDTTVPTSDSVSTDGSTITSISATGEAVTTTSSSSIETTSSGTTTTLVQTTESSTTAASQITTVFDSTTDEIVVSQDEQDTTDSTFTVLAGTYEVSIEQGGYAITETINCETAADDCSVTNVVNTMELDLHGMSGVTAELIPLELASTSVSSTSSSSTSTTSSSSSSTTTTSTTTSSSSSSTTSTTSTDFTSTTTGTTATTAAEIELITGSTTTVQTTQGINITSVTVAAEPLVTLVVDSTNSSSVSVITASNSEPDDLVLDEAGNIVTSSSSDVVVQNTTQVNVLTGTYVLKLTQESVTTYQTVDLQRSTSVITDITTTVTINLDGLNAEVSIFPSSAVVADNATSAAANSTVNSTSVDEYGSEFQTDVNGTNVTIAQDIGAPVVHIDFTNITDILANATAHDEVVSVVDNTDDGTTSTTLLDGTCITTTETSSGETVVTTVDIPILPLESENDTYVVYVQQGPTVIVTELNCTFDPSVDDCSVSGITSTVTIDHTNTNVSTSIYTTSALNETSEDAIDIPVVSTNATEEFTVVQVLKGDYTVELTQGSLTTQNNLTVNNTVDVVDEVTSEVVLVLNTTSNVPVNVSVVLEPNSASEIVTAEVSTAENITVVVTCLKGTNFTLEIHEETYQDSVLSENVTLEEPNVGVAYECNGTLIDGNCIVCNLECG